MGKGAARLLRLAILWLVGLMTWLFVLQKIAIRCDVGAVRSTVLAKNPLPCPSYFQVVPPDCQTWNFAFVVVVVLDGFYLVISLCLVASHANISFALVPCVGMYPSRSNLFLQACARDHSKRPTSSDSENLSSWFPLGNKGKQLLIFEIATAVFPRFIYKCCVSRDRWWKIE